MTDTVWWDLFAVIGMAATFASITVAIFCWKLPERTLPGEVHDLPASEVVARQRGDGRVVSATGPELVVPPLAATSLIRGDVGAFTANAPVTITHYAVGTVDEPGDPRCIRCGIRLALDEMCACDDRDAS